MSTTSATIADKILAFLDPFTRRTYGEIAEGIGEDPHATHVMAYIDERLQGIIRAPKTFGGQEARELQTILLLELRAATLGRSNNTRGNLVRFIRENVDESCSASPLNVRSLPDTLFDKLLSRFIREQISFQDAG